MGLTNSQFKSYMRSLLLHVEEVEKEEDQEKKAEKLEQVKQIMQDAIEDN
ncbi:MAG: hypothetical protein LBE55_00435 [Clostridiales bacterium]|jgi:ribosomal protein S20|nr:hypothetical protein [Clostridiales bacterium]